MDRPLTATRPVDGCASGDSVQLLEDFEKPVVEALEATLEKAR